MLVSILTPVFNGSAYIEDLINSVLSQTYANYEHVIIDDGSTDGGSTQRILKKYPHLRWWARENRGQYATQNELIKMSSGGIITVICADDLYASSDAIQKAVSCFQHFPSTEVLYGRTLVMRMTNGRSYTFDPHARGALAFRLAKYCPTIQHSSLFIRRELLAEHGLYFEPRLRLRGDWDWILRVLGAANDVKFLNEPIAYWRHHEAQTSRSQMELGEHETREVCKKHRINYAAQRITRSMWAKYGLAVAGIALARHQGVGAALNKAVKKWFS